MTLVEILLFILVLLFGIIAIKITFKFDINDFLKERKKAQFRQLQNLCPHATGGITENREIYVQSLFNSPPMTHQWQCLQCGLIINSEENALKLREKYLSLEGIERLLEDQKKFRKKAEKLKLI